MSRGTDFVRTLANRYDPHRVDPVTGVHVFRTGLGQRCLGMAMSLGFLAWAVWGVYAFFFRGSGFGPIWDFIYILLAVLLVVGAWRMWGMNVRVTPEDIVVRNLKNNYRIPANKVRSIDLGRKQQGDAGRALVWLPYIERLDGSVVWMSAMQGGAGQVPSEQLLGRVNTVRRLLGVQGLDHTQRIAGKIWSRSRFKR